MEPELDAIAAEIMAAIPREVPEYARPVRGLVRARSASRGPRRARRVRRADPRPGPRPPRCAGDLRRARPGRATPGADPRLPAGRLPRRRPRGVAAGAAAAARGRATTPRSWVPWRSRSSRSSTRSPPTRWRATPQAQSEHQGERERLRRALLELLLREPAADDADVRSAAAAAGWALPQTAAALACAEEDMPRLTRRLPSEVLAAPATASAAPSFRTPRSGPPRPARTRSGRPDRRRGRGRCRLASSAPPGRWRSRACGPQRSGAIRASGVIEATDWLASILIAENAGLIAHIGERRLASFAGSPPRLVCEWRRPRWPTSASSGNAAAMARSDARPPADRSLPAREAA